MPRKWLAATGPLSWRNSCNQAVGRHSSLFPCHQNPPSQVPNFVSGILSFLYRWVPVAVCDPNISDRSNRANSPFQHERYHFVAKANFFEAISCIRPSLGIFTLTFKAPAWWIPANGDTVL